MFPSAKKLGLAVTRWVDGDDNEGTWTFKDDSAEISTGHSAFETWHIWKSGAWPLGNWLKAPLFLLTRMNYIETVYNTWRHWRDKNDLTALSPLQRDIIRWYERA